MHTWLLQQPEASMAPLREASTEWKVAIATIASRASEGAEVMAIGAAFWSKLTVSGCDGAVGTLHHRFCLLVAWRSMLASMAEVPIDAFH